MPSIIHWHVFLLFGWWESIVPLDRLYVNLCILFLNTLFDHSRRKRLKQNIKLSMLPLRYISFQYFFFIVHVKKMHTDL